ncbi:MAG TPA: hypothetical protein VIK39_15480 [Candidatus Angelobacter sp.]
MFLDSGAVSYAHIMWRKYFLLDHRQFFAIVQWGPKSNSNAERFSFADPDQQWYGDQSR